MPRYLPLLTRHDEIARAAILAEGGDVAELLRPRVQQDTGDGIYAVFAGAAAAVRAALRFQRMMADERWPDGAALEARAGVHLGEAAELPVRQDGGPKLSGPAVDLAARVMSAALPGQVLLTREGYNSAKAFVDRVDGQFQVQWASHGLYAIKGLADPVELFEVGIDGRSPMTAPADSDKVRPVVEGQEGWVAPRPAVDRPLHGRPNWILRRLLGEGGFGEVWLAENRQTARCAALKFCFDARRLAALRNELKLHAVRLRRLGTRPDIAALHDVQLDHPPYWVEMDYYPGGNLADACAGPPGGLAALDEGARIGLALNVARALNAAHGAGVLHLDLKPTNVLMGPPDAGREATLGRPVLTDFGIGLLADPEARRELGLTAGAPTLLGGVRREAHRGGTLMYAAPELLGGAAPTTQSDIYSLGVLIYQLAVGDLSRPLAHGWERDLAGDPVLRADIAACVDGSPIHRLKSVAELIERLETLGVRRASEVGRLRAEAAAAEAKARAEQELREEVERQKAEIAAERQSAEAVLVFLTKRVLGRVRPEHMPDATVREQIVRMLIEPAATEVGQRFQGQPRVEAAVRSTIAVTLVTIGRADLALPQASAAFDLRGDLLGADHPDTLTSLNNYAGVLETLGRAGEAEPLYRQAMEAAADQQSLGPRHPLTLLIAGNLVACLLHLAKIDQAASVGKRFGLDAPQ
ncbi:MAG TPA: tetratricopeptide repeat protein [Tepidisphaeraceae bacterium]